MKPTIKPSNTIRSTIEIPKIQKLESPEQWLDRYSAVRSIARGLEIWQTMDPIEEDHDDDRAVPPKVESYSALGTRILNEARGEERSAPSEDAIIMLHSSLCKEAEIEMELYRERTQPFFKRKHARTPEKCGNVRWVITGRPGNAIEKLSASQFQVIGDVMQDPKWEAIRDFYIIQGHGFDSY